jgi:hypothetical protein
MIQARGNNGFIFAERSERQKEKARPAAEKNTTFTLMGASQRLAEIGPIPIVWQKDMIDSYQRLDTEFTTCCSAAVG